MAGRCNSFRQASEELSVPGSPLDDGSIFADSLVTPREHGHASLLPDSLSRSPSLGPDCVSRRLGVGESANYWKVPYDDTTWLTCRDIRVL